MINVKQKVKVKPGGNIEFHSNQLESLANKEVFVSIEEIDIISEKKSIDDLLEEKDWLNELDNLFPESKYTDLTYDEIKSLAFVDIVRKYS